LRNSYDIEKYKAEDDNDEILEKMNNEFEELKIKLKKSVHHPMLNQQLEVTFTKIDDIEQCFFF